VNKSPYLVCTLWEYDDIKQMPLHRFHSAELLDQPVRDIPGFTLECYVREQKEFDYPESDRKIRLVARFNTHAAHHLRETPLSEDQQIDEAAGHVTVSATVHDTSQLRWWILGFGDQVEVLKPKAIRLELASIAKSMVQNYTEVR
jgi:predicted DNA-binding transcriptional regulator YafY